MRRILDAIADHQGATLAILIAVWLAGYLAWVVAYVMSAMRP